MKDFINSYDRVKNALESAKVRNIFNLIDGDFVGMGEFEYSDEAMIVFDLVAKNGTGFVADICNRALESISKGHAIVLSDKQRWCVAFAAMKIDAAMVDELAKEDAVEDAVEDDKVEESESETSASVEDGNKGMLTVDDIRLVNEFQESGRVFIHLTNGKTIRRIMTSGEIRRAQIIRKKEGIEAFHREICRLFNEQYFDQGKPEYVALSAEDARFVELLNKKRICGFLTGDEEEEFHDLLTTSDF